MLNRRNPPDPSGPPVLDKGFLARLARHIGWDSVYELAADGLLELSDRLRQIEDFVAAEDREAVLRVEHDIAAVAGHIGLSALSLAAAGANREGRRDTARSARALAQPVLDLGPGSLAALRDLLDGEPPASAGPGAGDQGGLGTRPLPD